MASQSQTHVAGCNEMSRMDHNKQAARYPTQHQIPKLSNDKGSHSRERKSVKHGKAIENNDPHCSAMDGKTDPGISIPLTPLGSHHKPWLNSDVPGAEDVVKYMSSVPSYLQRLEKGDSVQEKALNFGVLDWGRLEKWTYLQKQATHRRGKDSPSSIDSSTTASFSTFGSSSQSTSSPSTQGKRTHRSSAPRDSTVEEGQQAKLMDEQNSVPIISNRDTKPSRSRPREKSKMRHTNVDGVSIDKSHPPNFDGSPSTSKVSHIRASDLENNKSDNIQLREKFHDWRKGSVPGNPYLSEDCLQAQCSVVEGVRDHIQEREHARRISCDSAAANNQISLESSKKSFSGKFPPSDRQFNDQPSYVPYSCPLPSTTSQGDEHSEPCNFMIKTKGASASKQGKHKKHEHLTGDLLEKPAADLTDRSDLCENNATPALQRESSPHNLLRAGLSRLRSSSLKASTGKQLEETSTSDNLHQGNATSTSRSRRRISPRRLSSVGLSQMRNSSLREGPSGEMMKQTFSGEILHEENATSSSRSRQSPFRRIFEPLLKSKDRQVSSRVPIPVGLKGSDEACGASDGRANHLPSQVSEAGHSVQCEKQVISTRRALLKLAWKNELPFLVFSSSDDCVLAATMAKGSKSKNCIYTIFATHELKRKSGIWLGQGNKSKKQDLAYNVVCEMRVSSSKSSSVGHKDKSIMREFVLYGCDLAPTAHGCPNSQFNSELAAIVVQVPDEKPENKCSTENLHVGQNKNPGKDRIVAILPSRVHGMASEGEPSPLIQRWKSGGSCDCGGWDEGCMLTVLTDDIQEKRTYSLSQMFSADGTYRIELFPQGVGRENKYAFRMSGYGEEVYAVEFGASIAAVQAFATCIAILHSRKPHTLSGLYYSMKAQTVDGHDFAKNAASGKSLCKTPTSYVPDCPPLSPIRRA